MFADDCLLHRKVNCKFDSLILQKDLNAIQTWCEKWRMNLNLDKAVYMRFFRRKTLREFRYEINNINPVAKASKFLIFFAEIREMFLKSPGSCCIKQMCYLF